MGDFFGIILIDSTEITLRIYKITEVKWQLFHYKNLTLIDNMLQKNVTAYRIAEAIVDFFAANYAEKVVDWRLCARNIPKETANEVVLAIGLPIEYLEKTREQELLAKGLFTEFW